jgi:lactoylglutathione lyase
LRCTSPFDDLEATVARLTEAKVTVLPEAEDTPWGERIATVADPEGNPVALCHNK